MEHIESALSVEEKNVMKHFQDYYSPKNGGLFVIPLPKKSDAKPLGESRWQAFRWFLLLEQNLYAKHPFSEVDALVKEYIELKHEEPVHLI